MGGFGIGARFPQHSRPLQITDELSIVRKMKFNNALHSLLFPSRSVTSEEQFLVLEGPPPLEVPTMQNELGRRYK